LASLLLQAVLLRLKVRWLPLGFRKASFEDARPLVSPALAIMALPLAQASFLQGTAIALGAAMSAAAVPAFTTARTLSRIGLQMTQLLSGAMLPEYSVAVAREDRAGQASMLALTIITSLLTVLPFAVIFLVFGSKFIYMWTGGAIASPQPLITVMSLTIVLGGFWNPIANLILAMNKHASYSYTYVVLSVLTIPSSYYLSSWLGVTGAGVSIALLDAGMFILILWLAKRMLVSRRELMEGMRVWRVMLLKLAQGAVSK